MHDVNDTIAAVATAPGSGAIAILRVSGPGSFAVADAVFRASGPPPSARPSHTLVFGRVVDATGDTLDQAILLIMRAPRTFTGEDVVEIQCHGGAIPVARILRRLLESGCRAAGPGEFTRRAFLNGKMDLTRAEAVMDLVSSHSDRAARAALRQLEGDLRRRIDALLDRLLKIAASMESSLDFPEEDIPEQDIESALCGLSACQAECLALAASEHAGRIIRDGLRIAICGRPNVGKSSLFNRLLSSERSIVSSVPGTTRDTVDAWISIRGIPVLLIDTAGLRSSDCPVETEGIRRTKAEIDACDIVLYVMDASDPTHADDLRFLGSADPRKTLVAVNKADLVPQPSLIAIPSSFANSRISCLQSLSLEQFVNDMHRFLSRVVPSLDSSDLTVTERHRSLLLEAARTLDDAIGILKSGRPDGAAIACSSLREGIEHLGSISGRTYTDDMLDRIFETFCIGK